MKLMFLLPLVAFITSAMATSSCTKSEGETPKAEVRSEVLLGDPFIMLYDGVYYAYGTHAEDGIEVYTSTDLKEWKRPATAYQGLALHKADVWGDRWFWAPEVYHINGKFYMYFSAEEHICVAIADSPLGPFKQVVQKPIIENEKCIDNSLFIDEDGKAYLSFVRFNDGNNVWIAELNSDLSTIKTETMHKCINVSQPWEEVWPRVNEGQQVVKHNGVYYMTYSANSYESPFYGVGYATASNPLGSWTKFAQNPILQKPSGLVGVGHSALFTDKEGNLRIVFHAHFNDKNIHPRGMYIGNVSFKASGSGTDVMVVDPSYITPHLK